jgi:hypothetical protein
MKGPSNEERFYPAAVLAFLVGLIGLGLLGLPALVVAALGVAVAALAIAAFRRPLEGQGRRAHRSTSGRQRVPQKYAPSVLESGTRRRRRGVHRRRHRGASPPLHFR